MILVASIQYIFIFNSHDLLSSSGDFTHDSSSAIAMGDQEKATGEAPSRGVNDLTSHHTLVSRPAVVDKHH
jgi:hypothetical protein